MKYLFFLLITFSATPTLFIPSVSAQIIWNVGQGQWFTSIEGLNCLHLDMGGESAPLGKILKHCRHRNNYVLLSHWDWDHISFLRLKKIRELRHICVAVPPQGKASRKRQEMLAQYSLCTDNLHYQKWSPQFYKNRNSSSHVFILRKWLLPGDSTTQQERIWSQALPLREIEFLVLGHHGSRTSTSRELLQKLPNLKTAIASAREKKYRHPHPQVQALLKYHRVPLLRTEDWGNIWFL